MPLQALPQVSFMFSSEELATTAVMSRMFNASKASWAGRLFVDSGANEGLWSNLAASMGIRALAVEPQLRCLGYIAAAATRNRLATLELHQKVISATAFSLPVRDDECAGTSQYLPNGHTADVWKSAPSKRTTRYVRVSSISLDELVGPSVQVGLWHLDTEGAEVPVLRSASRLIAERRLRNVILEWRPRRWGRFNISMQAGIDEANRTFAGWTCRDACGHRINWRARTTRPSICIEENIFCSAPQEPGFEDEVTVAGLALQWFAEQRRIKNEESAAATRARNAIAARAANAKAEAETRDTLAATPPMNGTTSPGGSQSALSLQAVAMRENARARVGHQQ